MKKENITNNNELIDYIIEQCKLIKKSKELSGVSKRSVKVHDRDIANVLIKSGIVKRHYFTSKRLISQSEYVLYNYDYQFYESNGQLLKQLIDIIMDEFDQGGGLMNMVRYVEEILQNKRNLSAINPAPSYLLKYLNCVYNCKDKTVHDINEVNYDFLNCIMLNYKKPDELNDNMKNIVNTIINDWSGEDNKYKTFIKQLFFAGIEGNGRNKYIFLKSDGGNGKTTALDIMTEIIGSHLTANLNMHDLEKDVMLADIDSSIKIVKGDDSSTKQKLSGLLLSRFKSFTSGDAFDVNRKYLPKRTIQNRGLKIQNTNTDPAFIENTEAVRRRIILFEWPDGQFKEKNKDLFNLDQLLGKSTNGQPNKDFLEAFNSIIITNTEYFNEFDVPQEMIDNLNDQLNGNDTMQQFINYCNDKGLFHYSHIPVQLMHSAYIDWLKLENPGTVPMKKNSFTKEFKQKLEKLGYIYLDQPRKTTSSLSLNEFNKWLFVMENDSNENYYSSQYFKAISRNDLRYDIYYNKENVIDRNIIENYLNQLDNKLNFEDFLLDESISNRIKQIIANELYEDNDIVVLATLDKYNLDKNNLLNLNPNDFNI